MTAATRRRMAANLSDDTLVEELVLLMCAGDFKANDGRLWMDAVSREIGLRHAPERDVAGRVLAYIGPAVVVPDYPPAA